MTQKRLISIKPVETRLPEDIYNNFETIIREQVNKLPEPDMVMKPYKFPLENIQKIAESDNNEYKESIRNMADDLWAHNDWTDTLIVYYILMHITNYTPVDFYKLGYTLGKLNKVDMAEELINIYQSISVNKKVTYHALANFYYCAVDIPEKAVKYFEKYIEFDNTNAAAYSSLGHLYPRIDKENGQEKQFAAFKKAYELKPDSPNIIKNMVNFYEKTHNDEKIREFYPKLLKAAPSPRHSLDWGIYLVSRGEIKKGCSYMIERYDLDKYPIGYPKEILSNYPKWNYRDDISDKTLLIHYEEGFGDSIMFGRFLPLLKQYAAKTILVIQPPLEGLFRYSKDLTDGVEIFSDIKDAITKYDKFVHMPLMDMPYPLGIDSDFIPYAQAYITAPAPVFYDKSKINIGIAYNGDVSANYNGRDIELKEFYNIASLNGVQMYSLQAGDAAKQLDETPRNISIIDLGRKFKDFTDTANAIQGLDLVISSDNVILNLAGALGKKTYGIFNKYPNYRWFDLSEENVVWYESVKPFICEKENDWAQALKTAEEYLKKEFLNG